MMGMKRLAEFLALCQGEAHFAHVVMMVESKTLFFFGVSSYQPSQLYPCPVLVFLFLSNAGSIIVSVRWGGN